jgi:FixJ family two-component response regulator
MDAPATRAIARETASNTVVIVDDDEALRRALRFDLELEGLSVQTYAGARDIDWERLPSDHACLVIDYRLAGIDGVELLKRLRSRRVMLPAIVITSHPSAILRAQISKLGATLIEKPLLGDQLIGSIRDALAPGSP